MAYETAEVKLLERMANTLDRIEILLTPRIALTATAVHHPNVIPLAEPNITARLVDFHPRRALAESEEFHIDNPDHNS